MQGLHGRRRCTGTCVVAFWRRLGRGKARVAVAPSLPAPPTTPPIGAVYVERPLTAPPWGPAQWSPPCCWLSVKPGKKTLPWTIKPWGKKRQKGMGTRGQPRGIEGCNVRGLCGASPAGRTVETFKTTCGFWVASGEGYCRQFWSFVGMTHAVNRLGFKYLVVRVVNGHVFDISAPYTPSDCRPTSVGLLPSTWRYPRARDRQRRLETTQVWGADRECGATGKGSDLGWGKGRVGVHKRGEGCCMSL